MHGKVIERRFIKNKQYGQTSVFIDVRTSWTKADKLAGKRLDRRRSYAIIEGKLHTYTEWTSPCTGCSCNSEYPCMCCQERGAGCHECGGTGKRRSGMWTPLSA